MRRVEAYRRRACVGLLAATAACMTVPPGRPATSRASTAQPPPWHYRVVDDFDSLNQWSTNASGGVEATIHADSGAHGRGMRLDFDFHGHSGYVIVHRELDLELPVNYAFSFAVRGHAPPNTLELKLVDSSQTNVWWSNSPGFDVRPEWRTISRTRHQICYAWGRGPVIGPDIHHAAAIEFAITADAGAAGGAGAVWFDDLTIASLDPESPFGSVPPEGSPTLVGSWLSAASAPNGVHSQFRIAADGTVLAAMIVPMDDAAYEMTGGQLTRKLRDAAGRGATQTTMVRIEGDSLVEKDGYGPGRDVVMHRVGSSLRTANPIVGLWTFPWDAALTTFVDFEPDGRMRTRISVNACEGRWTEPTDGHLTLTFNRVTATFGYAVVGDVLTLRGAQGGTGRYIRESSNPSSHRRT